MVTRYREPVGLIHDDFGMVAACKDGNVWGYTKKPTGNGFEWKELPPIPDSERDGNLRAVPYQPRWGNEAVGIVGADGAAVPLG